MADAGVEGCCLLSCFGCRPGGLSLGGVGVQSLEIGDEDLIQKFPFLTSYSATLLLSMSRLLCPKRKLGISTVAFVVLGV